MSGLGAKQLLLQNMVIVMARRKKKIVLTHGRGQPKKAAMWDNESQEEAVFREKERFLVKQINQVGKYYKMLEDIALAAGEFKDASITARKTAAETLIEMVEENTLYEDTEEYMDKVTTTDEEDTEENEPKKAKLISLSAT